MMTLPREILLLQPLVVSAVFLHKLRHKSIQVHERFKNINGIVRSVEMRQMKMTESLTMIAAANFAKSMAKRLVGDVQGLTVDEIELDERSNEWVVAVSFWLPTPAPKSGMAVISPVPLRREERILRIGAKAPPRLISMKVRPPVAS